MARLGMHAWGRLVRVGLSTALASAVIVGCGSDGTTSTPGDNAGAGTDGPAASPTSGEPASGESDAAPAPAAGDATGEGLCALFTTDEMANVLDRPVQAGVVDGPQDTLCQWVSDDWEADVSIQRVDDPDYWDPPTGEDGYVAIDVGDEGYLVPWLDGRTAAAKEGSSLYYVSIAPAPEDDEILLDLLVEFMERSSV